MQYIQDIPEILFILLLVFSSLLIFLVFLLWILVAIDQTHKSSEKYQRARKKQKYHDARRWQDLWN